MMAGLSALLSAFGGGWLLRLVTLPLIALAALVGFHTLIENWKGNLRAEGERRCDARWEAQIREEERKKSASEVFAARELLNIERGTTERLNAELDRAKEELDALRGASSGLDDGRCLSDGVLDRLGPQHLEGPKRRKPSADKKPGTS